MQRPVTSVHVLGPIEVRVGDAGLNLAGQRSKRILATLVEAGPNGASTDRLARLVWDDSDRPLEPTPHVRTAISRLRRQLTNEGLDASAVVQSRTGGYCLGPEVAVDAWIFEDGLSAGQPEQAADRRLGQLDELLEFWRGDPYGELAGLGDLGPSHARLTDLRLGAEEERLSLLLQLGEVQRVVSRAQVLADAHPFREELRRLHALALYRSGRQTDALRVLADHGETIRSELGLEPAPELVALEHNILNHSETLPGTEPGRALRGYLLHETLGSVDGSPPSVRRRATQAAVDRPVVIETISLDSNTAPEITTLIAERVRLRSTVRHRYLEPLVDHWREPGSLHVVTPLYRATLDDELAIGALEPSVLAPLVLSIASALDAAHAHGLVHGDLGVSSVLFDDNGATHLGHFPPGTASTRDDDLRGFAELVAVALTGTASPSPDAVEQALRQCLRPVAAARALDAARSTMTQQNASEFAGQLVTAAGWEVSPSPPALDLDSPYPGLASFDEYQADDFFGREFQTQELCELLSEADRRLVVVTGASGSGKSSLLRAGVVPAIRRGINEGGERRAIAIMTPGERPIEGLVDALASAATLPGADPASLLAGSSTQDPDPLGKAIRQAVGHETEFFLVIDQFEEAFTAAASEDTDRFLMLLAEALSADGTQLRVAASLRADWLDRPLQRQPFAGLLRNAIVPLAPLTAEELERAILLPALRRGVDITAALRSRLVNEVIAEPAALPLLSVALHELWTTRSDPVLISADDYEQIGGLSGALIGRAEALIDELGSDRVEEIRRLFGRVVTVNPDRKPTRKPARLTVIRESGVSQATIDASVEARLISVDRDPATRESMITPSHDTLLERWPRLAGWLSESRAQLHEHGRLASAAVAWDRDDRDPAQLLRGARLDRAKEFDLQAIQLTSLEAAFVTASEAERVRVEAENNQQARRRRVLTAAACAIAVVALLAGAVAVRNGRQAEAAATTAEIRLMTQAASAQFDERPALSLQLALAALASGGGALAEATLIDILRRSPFDRQLLTAANSQCFLVSQNPSQPALASTSASPSGSSIVTHYAVDTGDVTSESPIEISEGSCPVISPGGTRIAGVDNDEIFVVDATTGRRSSVRRAEGLEHLSWSLDGRGLLALFGSNGGRVEVLDPSSLVVLASVPVQTDFVARVVADAPDGTAVVTSDARPPLVIDLQAELIRELDDPGERISEIALTSSGDLVVGRSDQRVFAWSTDGAEVRWSIAHSRGDRSRGVVAVSELGSYVAATGDDGLVLVDALTGTTIREPLKIATGQPKLEFLGDSELIVVSAGDRVNVLDLDRAVEVVHEGIDDAAVAPNGALTTFLGPGERERAVEIGPDGHVTDLFGTAVLARHVDDRTLVGYDIAERILIIWVDGVRTTEIDLSGRVPEGSDRGRLIRVGYGVAAQLVVEKPRDYGTARLFLLSLATGELMADFDLPNDTLAVPIAPDRVALAQSDFGARIIDLAGNTTKRLGPFGHPINTFDVDSDGNLLVGLADGTIHRHNGATLELEHTLVGPPAGVWQLFDTDDGFVTAHQNGDVVRWYDGQDDRSVLVHQGGTPPGFGSLSNDGASLLMPQLGGVIRIPLDRDWYVAEACRRAGSTIDISAWLATTSTDPNVVADICQQG